LAWIAACRFDGSGNAGDAGGAGGGGGTGGRPSDAKTGDALGQDGSMHDALISDATAPDGPDIDASMGSPGVVCGSVLTCSGNMPICCVLCDGSNPECRPNANSCNSQGGRPLACDGPEDCPGQVCCIQPNGSTACQEVCANNASVCRPGGGACSGCCPSAFDPTCGGGSYYSACGLSC